MSQSPFEKSRNLLVGTVEFVSPNEIRVSVDLDAPDSIALNTGAPRPFPRVNSYLLVSVDDGFLVGQVEWMTIEQAPFPKRRGLRDFGLVDLPYPLRHLRINPVGMLRENAEGCGVFTRGTELLPPLAASVLLPTEAQLRSIVQSGDRRRVRIGTSPIAGDASVHIDPDRLFGRHLAVLGNTGSGKSCSVAGLIRWCLEQAIGSRQNSASLSCSGQGSRSCPNARFIVLDPNGEYAKAFGRDDPTARARVFKVGAVAPESELRVPLWFWNSSEWASFTQASGRAQRPLLNRALREIKAGTLNIGVSTDNERKLLVRRKLSSFIIDIRNAIGSHDVRTRPTPVGFLLKAIRSDATACYPTISDTYVARISTAIDNALSARDGTFLNRSSGETVEIYRAFEEADIVPILAALENAVEAIGGIVVYEGPGDNVPIPFKGINLVDHLEVLAKRENISQYLDFLVARIRSLLSDPQMCNIIDESVGMRLAKWLSDYIGNEGENDRYISVIDLSLVPTDIVHIVTAVIARMVFEAHQRHVKVNGTVLPSVLVIEEAHTFVKRYRYGAEFVDAATVCCQAFERIAREGRKFGLGLVVSSQRPSELSPTVLSQCNTFLLHRISNDRDQDIVHRLVPDNLRGLLRELPLLPSQNAILLGWASELPILVKMNDLPKSQQPRSEDPEYWKVWTGEEVCGTDWDTVAHDWQEGGRANGAHGDIGQGDAVEE